MFLSFIFFYFLFFFNDTATTEIYTLSLHDALPISGSTGINTAIFREGWQERLGISYGDLQWSETGERLTKESFEAYQKKGGTVIIYSMKPEWIREAIKSPLTMIASDGMTYAKFAHP